LTKDIKAGFAYYEKAQREAPASFPQQAAAENPLR